MTRKNPPPSQRERLVEANAHRCCVCKRLGIGLHLHHIDGNSANTVDENLAVLCVEDHDRHHRPDNYKPQTRHLELDATEIAKFKRSWEAFVVEARKPSPSVIATLAAYGTLELVHSLQLVLQWPDQRIEYLRSYHLLDGDVDRLTDEIMKELVAIGPKIQLVVLNEPLPVEHCSCCHVGLSRTLQSGVVARLTDPRWSSDSICAIYINPDQPSLAIVISLDSQQAFSGHLHLCQERFLHFTSHGGIDDRVPIRRKPSIRTQASRIVEGVLRAWSPAKTLIGTGDPDHLEPITLLKLPSCWEKKRQ